jgi:hypothetical protein
MNELKTSSIFGKLGELNIVNREIYCEQTDEWFNEVECLIEIIRDVGNFLTFPDGIKVNYEL